MDLDGEVEVAISEPIIHETPRVLQEKFGWPEERLKEALTIMESCATKAMPDQSLNVVPGDVDDNRIIECAIAAGSEGIVTGDKDLLRLGSYQGIKMIQAREILGWAR